MKALTRTWRWFIAYHHFEAVVDEVIMQNCAVTALDFEYWGRAYGHAAQEGPGIPNKDIIEVVLFVREYFFVAFSAVELVPRVNEQGRTYFPQPAPNMLDAFVVVISTVGVWLLPHISTSRGNLLVVCLVRLFRLLKIARIVRAMRNFEASRVPVGACKTSFGALFWSSWLLLTIVLGASVFISKMLISSWRIPTVTPPLVSLV